MLPGCNDRHRRTRDAFSLFQLGTLIYASKQPLTIMLYKTWFMTFYYVINIFAMYG